MKKYRQRIYYTEADKALMWDRWQQGESLHTIAGLGTQPASRSSQSSDSLTCSISSFVQTVSSNSG